MTRRFEAFLGPGRRLQSALFLFLLAALIAVLGLRAVRLARQPDELGGIDERKWFHSAGPVSAAARTFAAVKDDLPPDAEVWLRLPPEWDPVWWDWMARYHLPEQRIAGVLPRRGAPDPSAEAWIVAIGRKGQAVVRQTGRHP